MSMLSGKVWGATRLVLSNPFCEVHHIKIAPNSRCSLHLHHFKANGFLVFSGRLFIEAVKNSYALVDVTELGPGDFMVVAPNEKHRFVTKDEPCEAVEFYFPQANGDDIVRDDVGGKAERIEGATGYLRNITQYT